MLFADQLQAIIAILTSKLKLRQLSVSYYDKITKIILYF